MGIHEAAFINLIRVAAADGEISASERRVLERYRRALRLPRSYLKKGRWRKVGCPSTFTESTPERIHVLRSMVRVAVADGVIDPHERKLLDEVAKALEIGPIEFADIVVEVESEGRTHYKLKRVHFAAPFVALLIGIVIWLFVQSGRSGDREEAEQRSEALQAKFDEATLAAAREAERRIEAMRQEAARNEARLRARIDALEKQPADRPVGERPAVDNEELAELRRRLADLQSATRTFKAIERDFGESVVLVYSYFKLTKDGRTKERWGTGTGFFVSSTGHVVTNKHVIQPWKFNAAIARYRSDGWVVDEKSAEVAIWQAGQRVKTPNGSLYLDSGWSTWRGTLKVVGTAPDSFEHRAARLRSGGVFRGRYHVLDHRDLALLKAELTDPVQAIALANRDRKPEKLDEIMVLGYPGSISLKESRTANTAPSRGQIRKVEKSIFVTASVVPGNSGGPVFATDGTAVGVAFATYGAATVAGCIPSWRAIDLLPDARSLLAELPWLTRHEAPGAILDHLALVEQRAPSAVQRKRITEERARLKDLLAERLRAAHRARDEKRTNDARSAYDEILRLFGPRWGAEARRELDLL